MIIIKTISTQISFPKSDTWAIYTQNEYYLDQNGDIAPDIYPSDKLKRQAFLRHKS